MQRYIVLMVILIGFCKKMSEKTKNATVRPMALRFLRLKLSCQEAEECFARYSEGVHPTMRLNSLLAVERERNPAS